MNPEKKDKYQGTWIIPDIPREFDIIMKELGFGSFERQVFKRSKVLVHASISDDDILTLKIDSVLYKDTHDYPLDNTPVEYIDSRKRAICEKTTWIDDDDLICTETRFTELNLTLLDTKQILEGGDCLHKLELIRDEGENIGAEVTYKRKI